MTKQTQLLKDNCGQQGERAKASERLAPPSLNLRPPQVLFDKDILKAFLKNYLKTIYQVCPVCKRKIYSGIEMKYIKDNGECMSHEQMYGEVLEDQNDN